MRRRRVVTSSPPTFQLYGAHTGNCLRVAVALEVLDLRYKPTFIDLAAGEHTRPGFLKLNPFGKLPVLVEHREIGSRIIGTQSNALLFYLSGLRPGQLLPERDPVLGAAILERFFYFVTEAIGPGGDSWFLRRKGSIDGADLLSHKAVAAIVGAEAFLASDEFFSGPGLGLADVAAIPLVHANASEIPWTQCPRLRRWYESMLKREPLKRGLEAFSKR